MNNVTYIAEWKERENKEICLKPCRGTQILEDIDKAYDEYITRKKQMMDEYDALQDWFEDG